MLVMVCVTEGEGGVVYRTVVFVLGGTADAEVYTVLVVGSVRCV